jgi:hypothetical protein
MGSAVVWSLIAVKASWCSLRLALAYALAGGTPNHREQQDLGGFNGQYGHYCYLPMLRFLGFNHEPDQHLFAAVLRSGVTSAKDGGPGVLRSVLAILRRSFPKANILERMLGLGHSASSARRRARRTSLYLQKSSNVSALHSIQAGGPRNVPLDRGHC